MIGGAIDRLGVGVGQRVQVKAAELIVGRHVGIFRLQRFGHDDRRAALALDPLPGQLRFPGISARARVARELLQSRLTHNALTQKTKDVRTGK